MMLLSKLHLAFLDIESTSWLCTHENGLLEIFLMVCETSDRAVTREFRRAPPPASEVPLSCCITVTQR